ncbi:uncharacterized protein [Henckelia pumila]|uniref:uncharacterized protein n=1 Tax=Henckelia pumila TaxID=405737 RepID=UPI003C6E2C61
MRNQGRQQYNPYSNTYNPGWNNHLNLSWKYADLTVNKSKLVEQKPSFEEIMMKYVAGTETRLQNQEAMLQRLETQMAQIATKLSARPEGSLPSNTIQNPRDVNAIIVVTRAQHEESKNSDNGKNMERTKSSAVKEDTHGAEHSDMTCKKKKDVLAQMPNYAKFLKDLLKNKKNLYDITQVTMNEECLVVLQNKRPRKFQDTGSFSIPCQIGSLSFEDRLGISNIEPANISLKFADGSIKYPRGVVENVLVKIDKFIYPIDFVILDMDENCEVPLILGSPFLAMSRALIDVEKGELVLRMNAEHVVFHMLKSASDNPHSNSYSAMNFVDVFEEFFDKNLQSATVTPKDAAEEEYEEDSFDQRSIFKRSVDEQVKKEDAEVENLSRRKNQIGKEARTQGRKSKETATATR